MKIARILKVAQMAGAAAVVSATLAGAAAAQCVNVDAVIVPEVRVDPLDAAGPGELAQPLVLTFRRAGTGSEPIDVRYQIVDEDSSVRSRIGITRGPVVAWQSDDAARDIGALRSEAYSLLRSGRALIGENEQAAQRQVILRLTNLREDLSAGIYRERFTVRFWCGEEDGGLPYEAYGVIAVAAAVPNVLSANIAGASSRGEIDFLNFDLLSRTLHVSVRSTGPYQVTARSVNGGVMLREQARERVTEADRIEYTVRFGGQRLDLDNGGGFSMQRAGLLGRQIPLHVTIEDVSAKRAGIYADTLLLTLSPAN